MADESINPNVVLTADNSQYDQAMMQSAGSTDQLGKAVDGLTAKISSLTKSAGKGLIGITAADVALIGAATAAWSSYEKQVSLLNAQAAVLTRTHTQQSQVFKDYTNSVKTLRTEYGATTAEAAKLTQTLAKMTSLRQTRELGSLSKVFMDMSKATGESSQGLASSLTNLQKVMGTDINASNSRKYADTFTYLAAQTNTSAQGLIDFTAQLAPTARAMGMNEKQVAGFATAFTRAGAEGTNVANVFTKVTADISKSLASGSPELAHYANLVGRTSEEFKKMDSAEQMVQIFEHLQKMGPRASTELNRLGLDGVRSMRSITAVINEAGGIREALGMAQQGQGAAAEGAKASKIGMSDDLAKLRQNMQQTAETFGSYLGPIMEKWVQGMNKVAETVGKVVEGPLGKFAALVAGILAPLAGGAGAMLLFAGALLKVASAFTLMRNSGAYGFREAMKGTGAPITRMPDGTYSTTGTGAHGRQIAQSGTWFQRGLYNTGTTTGSFFSSMRDRYVAERLAQNPNYQGRGMLAPLSYAAGGTGRALQQFVNPLYDQMRYADPTKRSQWLQQTSPWGRAMDRADLGRAMGTTGRLMGGMDTIREQIRATHTDPLLTNRERAERLENLRTMRSEQNARVQSSLAQEQAARTLVDEQKTLAKETRGTTQGMGTLRQGIREWRQAATGAMFGGLRAGAGATPDMIQAAAQNRAMVRMGGSVMAMGAMGAAGVDSNALMFGAMGTMFGTKFGLAGAGLGLGLDVYKQHKAFAQSQEDYKAAIASGQPSAIYEQYKIAAERRADQAPGHYTAGSIYRGTLTGIESLFTGRDAGKEQQESDTETVRQTAEIGMALSELSGRTEAKGKAIPYMVGKGAERSWERFDEVVQKLQPAMDQLDITVEDIGETFAGKDTSQGLKDWNELMDKLAAPGMATGMYDRLAVTAAGAEMIDNKDAKKAIRYQEDVGAFYDATNSMLSNLRDKGMTYQQIIKSSEQAQQKIADPNTREYELMMALSGRAQSMVQFKQPFQSRVAGFEAQTGAMSSIMGVKPKTDEQAQQMEQTRDAFVGMVTQQYQYFQNLLYQQREFNVSQDRAQEDFGVQRERMEIQYNLGRQRAQEDFHTGRVRQEFDYQLTRERAEDDYNLSRKRGQDDYDRSVRRSRADFNRQRLRQEQDFNHQVMLMVEQSAQQMYSIYDRVQVESVNSATYLLSNSGDQLKRMQEQTENLNKLREMGVNDNVIQQMGLTDASNAQQLESFVNDLANNPELVQQFNKQIKQRLKAARNLVTDESSTEWQEFQRQYTLARKRASSDFERSVARGHKDFIRQMERMEQDFRKQMNRGAEDYERAQSRQQEDFSKSMKRGAHDYGVAVDQMTTDFHKSMRRAQADLERSAEEITGSLTTMLRKATNELGGNASEQARSVLQALRGLRREAGMEGNTLMEVMSDIFGFDFKPVKVRRKSHGDDHRSSIVPQNSTETLLGHLTGYSGGVLPGYTPNRDVHQFYSATGGELHLSGGEAIMVPEWTQAVGGPAAVARMNAKARAGGSFASGGIPALGDWKAHSHSDYSWTRWAGDINIPGSGDYGNPVRAYKDGTVSAVVYLGDTSYGRYVKINHPDSNENTLYAHLSRASVDVGDQVKRGEVIGNVGDLGKASGPHLHFEISGGTSPIQIGSGGGRATVRSVGSILKDRYPEVEEAAAKFNLLGGFPDGWWSKKINKMARKTYNRLAEKYGTSPAGSDHQGVPPEPKDGSNQELMRKAMRQFGWNQWPSLYALEMGEAGFDNLAQNPTSTAFGMGQFLDDTWATVGGHKTTDPWLQSIYMMRYIKDRYGDPRTAYQTWNSRSPHWYGEGGLFEGAQTIGIGEKGPEAVIPLNDRGADFMVDLMNKTKSGLSGRSVGLAGSTPIMANTIHNYRIDRSTTFTGDITVQANNPGELINQLRARQKVQALSQPVLGGVRV